MGLNTDFVSAPANRPHETFSGSGSRAMMIDTMKQYGPDSFPGLLSCVFQGSSDTTFYIVALYFGSVGIKKTRYTISAGPACRTCRMITAILTLIFSSIQASDDRYTAEPYFRVKRMERAKRRPQS
jgi:spore maturation protein SpmB